MTTRCTDRFLGRVLPVAFAALLLAGLSPGGQAEAKGRRDLVRAKRLFRKATIRFNLGEYEAALELYRKAYTVKPLPGFLFNIGQCHYNLRNHREALSLYQRYLLLKPDAPNRADVEAQIRAAKKALAEQEATASSATGPPATEAPKTDGTSGTTPTPATDAATGVTDEEPPGGTPATPPAAATASAVPATDMPDVPRRPTRRQKILLWSGVGLSAALLITGSITRGVALSMSSEYSDPNTPVDRQLDLKDSGETLTTVSTLTLALGAAAAVGTGVYYWFGYRVRRPPPTVSVAPLPFGGGIGMACGGTF